jgi:peroxiredoxin
MSILNRHYFTYATGVLLLASLSLNLIQNRRIHSQLESNVSTALQEGDKVPPLQARDLHGRDAVVDYQKVSTKTIIYVFSPTCSWCRRNEHDAISLAESAKSRGYRFVGISLSPFGLARYVSDHHLTFPIYTIVSEDVLRGYKFGSTPQTLVISPSGRVLRVWTGIYKQSVRADLESFLGVRLPV